jgi:hypothetical protein
MGNIPLRKKTVEDILRDVCCSKKSKKKRTKRLSKMVETDVDIFADTEWLPVGNNKKKTITENKNG